MANIMFFNIPAHGHTNPTVEVVRELTRRGHRVRYYSFPEFQAKLEEAGAEFVSCEGAMPPAPDDLDKRVGRDFTLLMEMVIGVTENLHGQMEMEFAAFRPDCIVSDSVCIWGKLFAKRFGIPLVCSTTTLAFNRYTAGLMKQSVRDILRMFKGMPRVMKGLRRLEVLGYEAKSMIELLQNDNETNTVVYTSKRFQPCAETFSDRYVFVGPSIVKPANEGIEAARPQVYISMGTVLNKNARFYRDCIAALGDEGYDVIMSVGPDTNIEGLGPVPDGFEVYPRVDQVAVLSYADVFITHCGMNSVMESLSMGVPMVLFPQHAEERAVGNRAAELGAGILMKEGSVKEIRWCVQAVLGQSNYKEAAQALAEDVGRCAGAAGAADWIERAINEGK